jgi:hypothetical protein
LGLTFTFFKSFFATLLLLAATLASVGGQTVRADPKDQTLKDRIGELKAVKPKSDVTPETVPGFGSQFRITSAAQREYSTKDGGKFRVAVIVTEADAAAYALLTNIRRSLEKSASGAAGGNVGTSSVITSDKLAYAQGRTVVVVQSAGNPTDPNRLKQIGMAVSAAIDKGEGEIPVLVKHLPDWENAQRTVLYVVNEAALKNEFANQHVLDAVSFQGGVEAVVADYQGAKLVVVEFNTPQIATDNNQRILNRIQELRNQGQTVPTAYRRVGNYSVFVFDGPGEQAANQLIDQVKYQQVVQWLGRNPYLYEEATREFTQTTLGVFVAVVKASGLALLTTFGVGGLIGALLFSRRRKQQRAVRAYSDAGGMLRLNLDEMTPRTDPARLLGPRT